MSRSVCEARSALAASRGGRPLQHHRNRKGPLCLCLCLSLLLSRFLSLSLVAYIRICIRPIYMCTYETTHIRVYMRTDTTTHRSLALCGGMLLAGGDDLFRICTTNIGGTKVAAISQVGKHDHSRIVCRCRAIVAHVRQSRPEYGLGVQVKGIKTYRLCALRSDAVSRPFAECMRPILSCRMQLKIMN